MVALKRLLHIGPNEGRRTTLLYILAFLLIIGSVWGETASKALFIERVGVNSYSLLFIAEAFFTLAATLIYTAFVDRVSDARLLAMVCMVTIAALVLTGLGLAADLTLAFYVFYLIGRATRVVFAVHLWTYIGDFYDTRAAKRVFPLIGSAGRVAGILGGFVFSAVVGALGTANVAYLWAALLAAGAWLTLNIPRWTGQTAPTTAQGRAGGTLDNFRGGWEAIAESRLLKLLAVGAVAMTILLALLNFQADFVFSQHYQDADALAGVFGVLVGFANAIALPMQLLFLTRIVNRLGVGWSSLMYPILAVCSYGLLGGVALLPLAVLAYFVQTGFLSGVRNPLDNMLYNAVPRVVKGRARAFVNGMLVPVATFAAGGILLFVPEDSALPLPLFLLGGAVGLVYLWSTWNVRTAYRESLLETLAAEDSDIYRLAGGWGATDRAAMEHVLARFPECEDENTTIFLAQLAYEIGGRDAVHPLSKLAFNCTTAVRAAIIEIVGAAGLSDPLVRKLCTEGLADDAPDVRRAALMVLDEQSGPEDVPLLSIALDHLRDPDPGVRARAISLLLRSGDFFYLTSAAAALNEMLTTPAQCTLALSVLGEMDDPRVVRTLIPYLSNSSESIRRAAAQAVAAVASGDAPDWVQQLTLEAAKEALSDSTEAVRLAGVQVLSKLKARSVLMEALADESRRVRENARQALEDLGADAVKDLAEMLSVPDARVREVALVALLKHFPEQYAEHAEAEIEKTIAQMYRNLAWAGALTPLNSAGAALAVRTLEDYNHDWLDRVFRILKAQHGHKAGEVIRHNLQSEDARVRANAIEALETVTSPQVTRLIVPAVQHVAQVPPAERGQVLMDMLTNRDAWLRATGLYLANEDGMAISADRRRRATAAALSASVPLVVETAAHLLDAAYLARVDMEVTSMLSTIEKVIFLREVPLFDEISVAQLRTLADIAEEMPFNDDEIIFHEGDLGNTLYVVVSGRVGLERASDAGAGESVARIATLEPRQYFGETDIFNEEPSPVTAVAVGQTLLLGIRREPLVTLVENDPTLALDLIRTLSQRLREANEQLALKTKTIPRRLHKLYDQLT